MENDIKAEVGHRFMFRAKPMGDLDGKVNCEALDVVPHERLVYSWRGGSGKHVLDTTVPWTLAAKPGGGTRLRLVHAGFTEDNAMAFEKMGRGWHDYAGALAVLSEMYASRIRSTIGDILTRTARRVPDAMALAFGDRTWTYRELDEASTRVAHALHAVGLVKGDRVAAFGKNSDAYVLLWLGVQKAGLVHVPINFALAGRELAYLVHQSGARAVFADRALRPAVEACGVPVEILGSLRDGEGERDILAMARRGDARPLEVVIADDDIAQLLYTSGTTSDPKGAILTHRALIHHYASAAMALDMRATDRQLHALPLYHSAQMHVFLMPSLMLGAPNWLLEGPDPAAVLDQIATHQIVAFFAAPTVWIALLTLLERDPTRAAALVKAYYGASIMPTPVLQRLRTLLPALGFYNCFGQSENGPLATVLRPEEHDARPASAGRAIPFVDMRVVDDDLNDVAAGEVGEVVYRSPQLCLGYWNKPEETREAFEGGWFHSGDLARIDAEGFITIVDRKKEE